MTKYQEVKLNMYRATQQVCNNNPTITATNVKFIIALGLFADEINAILNANTNQALKITGLTDSKASKKETVCEQAIEVAGIITAWADEQGDEDTLAKVHFSVSELMRLKDDEVVPVIQNIFNIATTNAVVLAPYGIDTAMLDALQAAMVAYSASTPLPKTAISERKSQGMQLKQMFATADRILKMRMDKLVTVFNENYPDFVTTYTNARVIYGPSYRTKKVKKLSKAA
jgi:hypothetical protein